MINSFYLFSDFNVLLVRGLHAHAWCHRELVYHASKRVCQSSENKSIIFAHARKLEMWFVLSITLDIFWFGFTIGESDIMTCLLFVYWVPSPPFTIPESCLRLIPVISFIHDYSCFAFIRQNKLFVVERIRRYY